MHAFLVDGENKVGELARICEAISKHGVNITTISAAACGGSGSVAVMTSDPEKTRQAFRDASCTFREIEAVECGLEDKPGSLAKACRKLADSGVNIEALLPTGMSGSRVTVAFVTSDPTKAKSALQEFTAVHA